MAYHKWSNFKPTLNAYRAILICHVAQSNCFNQMVGKKNCLAKYFKNPNDAMSHIFRLPRVNIFGWIIVASVVTSLVARTHI
jgi:hypothetical protein